MPLDNLPSPSPQPAGCKIFCSRFLPLFILAIVFPDISPPDYSDITMRVVNVTESQNGYYDLIKVETVSDSEGTIKNPLW
jgi:hypothetical protein